MVATIRQSELRNNAEITRRVAHGSRRVLLDTSVVITPRAAGLASIADFVVVCAVTVAELVYGVGAARRFVERQRRRRRLDLVIGAVPIIPFAQAAIGG